MLCLGQALYSAANDSVVYHETRDIRSTIASRLRELPRSKLEVTPEGKRLFLTVYPKSRHNTDGITFLAIIMIIAP